MVLKQAGNETEHSLEHRDGRARRSTNGGMAPGQHMSHHPKEGTMVRSNPGPFWLLQMAEEPRELSCIQ